MNWFYSLFLLIGLIVVLPQTSFVGGVVIFNPGTGHFYEYIATAVAKSVSIQACSSRTFEGRKGYLATFSSKQEWEFFTSKNLFPNTDRPWISGYGVNGTFAFDSGPEAGTVIYDFINDRSYSYTPWRGNEPNLNLNDNCINTIGSDASGKILWDLDSCALTKTYICEYGGMEEPYLLQPGTNPLNSNLFVLSKYVGTPPGSINLLNYLNQEFTATLSDFSNSNATYKFTSATPGVYTFNLGNVNGSTYTFNYRFPLVDVVYPSYSANQLITLVGQNFGSRGQDIQVTYANGKTCSNVILVSQNVITCSLGDDITVSNRLLPLGISLNGAFVTYKTIGYYDVTKKGFISATLSAVTYQNYLNVYTARSTAAKNPAAPYYPPNDGDIMGRFFKTVPLNLAGSVGWNLWIGATFSGGRIYAYGTTNPITIYGGISTYAGTPPFIMNVESPTLSIVPQPETTGYASIMQYGGALPTFDSVSTTNAFSTEGGIASFKLTANGCGHYFSTYDCVTSNFPASYPSSNLTITRPIFLDTTTISLTVPPYYGGTFITYFLIDGQRIETPISFYYDNPTISSVTPVSPLGGKITIDGSNFYTNSSIIKIYVDSVPITQFSITVNHRQIVATIPPLATGNHTIYLTVGDRSQSNNFVLVVFQPFISSARQSVSSMTLTGGNFDNITQSNTIYFNGQAIKPTSGTTTILVFELPVNAVNDFVAVESGGVNSTAFSINLIPNIESIQPTHPSVLGGSFTITGNYLNPLNFTGSSLDTSIEMGVGNVYTKLSCTQISSKYPYQITCLLPPGSGSYALKITWGVIWIENYHSYLSPTILYTAPPLIFGTGGNTTIVGSDFAEKGLSASIGNIPCDHLKFINSTAINCYFSANVTAPTNAGINVTVTSDTLSTTSGVFYYKTQKECPATVNGVCDGHGTCNRETGLCSCNQPYIQPVCNNTGEIGVNRPVLDPNGGTTIIGNGYNFSVQLVFLRELDETLAPVKTLALKNIVWTNRNQVDQTMNIVGSFHNESVILSIQMTIYNESTSVVFAGETIDILANSIKYVITVSNWTFASRLNTLQVIYNSMTDSETTSGCQTHQTTAEDNGGNGQSLSYLQMNAGDTSLTARFADRLYVDSNIVNSLVSVIDPTDPIYKELNSEKFNLLVSINVPHFEKNTIIDPNFGSLVSTTDSHCSEKQTWKIPVIVIH
ncbi:hypothetical protein PPL_01305 [Heterostelium album PN500]|uniref:C-type lectin domain-containing protein n=1 Tax=Heterostelium pallidum (strain ATCC 26659 / Pp 5 / PN500) TaxID=670386 RepID=D3AYP1_HETP5|nr:hypothetical protein PPL_01305 [Heterostelium album PN500]EFA86068.1 hypothetical protein PPL_01305 [Heterostelium album PN500]|eukprot:XP_020438174.1 hypothetical protein PPL_01305 [Heterostelium album PN500]